MRMGMDWMFRELCRWEVGGTSGMVTGDSETFRLDNLECEVVGEARGAPGRGGISKNGSNK
jgi:hypothetical protein